MLKDPAVGSLTEEQSSFLEIIDRNSLRLLRLIEDLLLVAKLESHTLPLSLGLLDLPDIVSQVVTELTPRARERGVELSVTTASGPRVRGDWVRLQQVVSNLVGNAISYTLPGGTVRVVADVLPETGHWSIAISDTGVGIPEDEIAHVFDAFFRATSASDAGGAERGRVAPASGWRSAGSSSTSTTGASRCRAHPASAPPSPSACRTRSPEMARILVVEDNPDIALALSALLQRNGHEVTRAGDGVEALRVAYDLHPQLVVLDIGLPKLDGWGVLSRIRELSDIPVLLLTARRPRRGQGARPARRGRRLPHQALPQRRARRPHRRAAPAGGRRDVVRLRPRARPDRALADPARGDRRRCRRLGDPARVRPAQHVPAPRGPGAHPDPDPLRGVGRPQRDRPGAGEVRRAAAAAQGRLGRRGDLTAEVGARHRLPARRTGLRLRPRTGSGWSCRTPPAGPETAPVLHPFGSRGRTRAPAQSYP